MRAGRGPASPIATRHASQSRRPGPARRRRRARRAPKAPCVRRAACTAWCSSGPPRAIVPRGHGAGTRPRTDPRPTRSPASGRSGAMRSRRDPPRSAPDTHRHPGPQNFNARSVGPIDQGPPALGGGAKVRFPGIAGRRSRGEVSGMQTETKEPIVRSFEPTASFDRMMRIGNTFIRPLLRSRFGRKMHDLALLSFTGRKSGRRYTRSRSRTRSSAGTASSSPPGRGG